LALQLSVVLGCSCKAALRGKRSYLHRSPRRSHSTSSPIGYAKNFAGLVQSLTVGLPQFSATPSWMFFRNSLLSDLLFTLLFVVCINIGRSAEGSRARAAVPRAA
jgi:hypothetical protein